MKKFQDANKKQEYYKFSHLGFKQKQQQQQQQQKVCFLSTMALSKTSSPITPKLPYTLHIFHSKTSPDVRIQSASIYVHKSKRKKPLKKKKKPQRLAHL
jgi:hypothetical protein